MSTAARAWRLAELSYPEVEAILKGGRRTVAIVPTGSVEAHGPHLPLCTDTLISVAVAERAAALLAEAGTEAVVFPALPYGVTDWAAGFAGTTSLPAEVTEGLVLHTCKAAKAMGFLRVAITNAHLEPGHIATLRQVCRRYEEELGEPLVFSDKTRRANAARLTAEFQSGSCHAGQYETSLVLAIRPELVRGERMATLPAHVVPLHEKIAAGAKGFLDCGLDQAYCGDPAAATAAEGEASLQALATMVVEAIDGSFA